MRYAWYIKRVPPGPFIQTMTENICHISQEKIISGIQRKRVCMIIQLLILQALFADVSNPHAVCLLGCNLFVPRTKPFIVVLNTTELIYRIKARVDEVKLQEISVSTNIQLPRKDR